MESLYRPFSQLSRLFLLEINFSLLLFLLTSTSSIFKMKTYGRMPSTQVELTGSLKPVVISLYGLPGSGKTSRLGELKMVLGNDNFEYYDGSDIIAAVTPGGLEGFQNLIKEAKSELRELAIARIKQDCCNTGKSAIVAGHFMFLAEQDKDGQSVCTPGDLATYTHILYLNVPAERIVEYRLNDTKWSRPSVLISHLTKWQEIEQSQLRDLCRCHDILFVLVSPLASTTKLESLIQDFRCHTETHNMFLAKQRMEDILSSCLAVETVIVMDADKTLAEEDSGVLFWEQVHAASSKHEKSGPLKALFSSPLGY